VFPLADIAASLAQPNRTALFTVSISPDIHWDGEIVGGQQASEKAHQATQVYGLEQWAGAVRIGGEQPGVGPVLGWCRSQERVWTLLVRPLESLPTALTVKGAGGEGQHGRRPLLVSALSGWLLFRMAARQLWGSLIQEPPRSS
jgi:hypothetical protein